MLSEHITYHQRLKLKESSYLKHSDTSLCKLPHSCRKQRSRTCHPFILYPITNSLSPSASSNTTHTLCLWNSLSHTSHKNNLCCSNGISNTPFERWARHRDPHDQESGFLGDVEAILWALPSHNCARWWPFKDHQGPWRLWLWALQPQWHQQDPWPQGQLHLLQGLCMPLLWLHGLQKEVHLHHWWWLLCESFSNLII